MHVQSEAITDLSYDARKARLFVRFHDGDRYVYYDVPATEHRAFVAAESKGGFFARRIRDHYRFEKLTR